MVVAPPSSADFHWHFSLGDEGVPAARDVEDVFRGRDGKPWFVDHVEVTVFVNCDEESTVRAEGRPFTKGGTIDRRAHYSTLVVISDEDERHFIAAAEALLVGARSYASMVRRFGTQEDF